MYKLFFYLFYYILAFDTFLFSAISSNYWIIPSILIYLNLLSLKISRTASPPINKDLISL